MSYLLYFSVALCFGIYAQKSKGLDGYKWGGYTFSACLILTGLGGIWWGGFGFIVALVFFLKQPKNTEVIEQQLSNDGQKKCPFCAEFVKMEAIVCKHCGRDLS